MINLTAKIVKSIAVGVILSACGINAGAEETSPAGLVARKDFNANQEWKSPQVMGRDFWNMLYIEEWEYAVHPVGVIESGFVFNNLKDTPVYKESGRGYGINIFDKDSNTVTTSEILRSSWSRFLKEGKGQAIFKIAFESDGNPNTPFFAIVDDTRPPFGNPIGDHNYDFAGYEQWKKDHPNFIGFTQPEWCNECISGPWNPNGMAQWIKDRLTKEQKENIKREFPNPSTREDALALIKKLCGMLKTFYFNDPEKLSYLRSMGCMDHYSYEWGAEMAWLETTNSGWGSNHYRWQSAFFFTRGASHQYGKKWGWYLASYYNGYPAAGGDMVGDAHVNRYENKSSKNGWTGPDCGMSLSLYTRAMYLAYLAGPSFVAHEAVRKFVNKENYFSPWGKELEEWFDFTQKNKRGITYAPVALLIPFEQCYPVYGGRSWFRYEYERPDWMIDAFMYTIAPHNPITRDGNEGCLSNSPYGDIYDAILPNTPEKPVSLDVLNKYKVAIMLGRYAKNKALADRLMEYVKEGGTLLININQLNEFFPESFTGVEKTNAIQPVKGEAISLIDNTKISLSEEYEFEKINLKGAKPVLVDSGKNALACVNNYGKGRVIVTTVDYLVPKKDFVHGKDYPLPAYFLRQIVKDVLPLEVKGDIEYGLNKLDDGWLLYLINNKGVTKFVDKIQSVDPSKTAKVEVNLKDLKVTAVTELRSEKTVPHDEKSNSFKIEVPPGEIRIVKIQHP